MYRLVVLLVLLTTACATTEIPRTDYIQKKHWPEDVTELPPDADELDSPEELPSKREKSVPIEKDAPAPEAGVLITEAKAWRMAQHKIEADALRKLFVGDRNVWRTHRPLYETQIHEDKKEIARLQPDFWDRHGLVIVGITTFLAGAGVTIGIAAAINEVQ